MIPLISSMCRGPLGVCQLPRFWWKTLLRQAGLLDAEYPDCSRGLDIWLLDAIGLDRDQTLEHVRSNRPTYLDFEQWVLEQKGGALDPYAAARYNEAVARRVHVDPGKIVETYEDIGWGYEQTAVSAVLLNCLQDWQLCHRRDLGGSPADAAPGTGVALQPPVVPLISSIDRGPLDVCQLPRTWLKVTLRARGLLHPEYPDFSGGLDARVLEILGLEPDATLDFLRQQLPDYLAFEAWGRDHGVLDQGRITAWNRSVEERVHRDEIRERIAVTVGMPAAQAPVSALVLNHIEDWHLAHAVVTGG